MRRCAAGALAGALALAGCAASPVATIHSSTAVLDRELAAIANDPERPLASLSVLAIRDGKIAYERHFGRRFIDPAGRGGDKPADTATLYRIASISKLVTTLGVMKLVEERKLSLDADIATYLGYRVRNPHFPDVPITLRMLLTHTSSLRDDAGYSWDASVQIQDVLQSKSAAWSGRAKPGAYFSYANLPWGVIGTVMERVTGERFDRLMKRLALDPLGLQGGYNVAELSQERLASVATLYRKATAGDTQVWNPQGPWIPQVDDYSSQPPIARAGPGYAIGTNGTLFGPQGGLRASAAELGRVMLMLMNGGEIDGKRILERKSVDEMLAMHWQRGDHDGERDYGTHRGRFNAWGLGNQRFTDISGPDFGDRLVEGGGFTANGHLGDAYGLMATLAFDPSSRNGFVFLVGGTGFDPETDRGAWSAGARFEERLATAIYRHAIQGRAD